MRIVVLFAAVILTFFSCDKKTQVDKIVEESPLELNVQRFDSAFFETKPEELAELKERYPLFFPHDEDAVWLEKMQNPIWQEVYAEVKASMGDFAGQTADLENYFKRYMHYFPATKLPEVYTLIGEMDPSTRIIYTGDHLLISLESFLGKDHKFYVNSFAEYLRANFEADQILPEVALAMNRPMIKSPDPRFISHMIAAGKQYYAMDLLLPDLDPSRRIGYTSEQYQWAQANEYYIWRNFLDSKILFDTNQKLLDRFINPAPFSKFYLEIDNESPGRIGTYIGLQIVRSYMKNNPKVSLKDLMQMDPEVLFEQSRYKPNKNE